jgi:hypothetical protein
MSLIRIPRLVLIAVVCAGLALAIYSWSRADAIFGAAIPQVNTTTPPSSSPAQSQSNGSQYLLGNTEDASRLWYPPKDGAASFGPSILTQNEPAPARLRTPLLIPFTRNNAMLIQTVLSYIAAGWPREDIVVIDNSGTMDANPLQKLSSTNPFYLDYHTLRGRYGVSVLQAPTLLTFSQLQNFFLRLAIAYNWRFYFWSHMDVVVLSDETASPYYSFHQRVLSILADLRVSSLDAASASEREIWALKYFTYDWLTLINVGPWRTIGTWDSFIPYYTSDCDAYSRVPMHGFTTGDVRAGHIFDIPRPISHPETKFFPGEKDSDRTLLNASRYQALLGELKALQDEKHVGARNKWQSANTGGKGDPWTYDPEGFQKMWWATADFGRELYKKKWGTDECRLGDKGIKIEDAFKEKS